MPENPSVERKKWPVFAQILIGLTMISSLGGLSRAWFQRQPVNAVLPLAGLVIGWNIYKFTPWALNALRVLLSVNLLLTVALFLTALSRPLPYLDSVPLWVGWMGPACALAWNIFVLVYFQSKKVKGLFK